MNISCDRGGGYQNISLVSREDMWMDVTCERTIEQASKILILISTKSKRV